MLLKKYTYIYALILLSSVSCHRDVVSQQPMSVVSDKIHVQRIEGMSAKSMMQVSMSASMPAPQAYEKREQMMSHPIQQVATQPVSTFSIDVDTGAYSNIRRWIQRGIVPQPNEVRIEEMLNYFDYDYPIPDTLNPPFSVKTEMSLAPWNNEHYLLQIGIQGYKPVQTNLPPANLVFLLDVSGSMAGPQRLGLLKISLKMLLKQLGKKDTVSIVVYAGAAGVVLEPTPATNRTKIIRALDALSAGGSTNGGEGIHLAYQLAKQAFIPHGINRVIMASDGDVNVGTTDFNALLALVKKQRDSGIALTTLGFGMGNYNDHLMEQLADAGNGQHAYIDNLNEARKVLVDEVTATLLMIAKDVKIQVEFNPEQVAEYRLIGYENRMLQREDFNNDRVDAGDIGAGHTVTALYEISLVGSKGLNIDPLRYGKSISKKPMKETEVAFLRLRYKQPEADESQLIEIPVPKKSMIQDVSKTSDDFRFSAAVAAFGEILRGGKYSEGYDYGDVIRLATGAKGRDEFGYRNDFISLVRTTEALEDK